MTIKTTIARLDDLLKPIGFERQKSTWNRKSGSFVDVVDVQVNKAENKITINVGVFHPDVHLKCWGNAAPKFIEEPFCTVRIRIGQLIEGKDRWWQLDTIDVVDEIANQISTHVLSFLEQMHSTSAIEDFLINSQVVKQKYPLPIIYLAILKYERGDANGACLLLNELRKRAVGAWKSRISQIIERLSCS